MDNTDDLKAPDINRTAAMLLLRQGEATVSEIAQILDTDRQKVWMWAKYARVNVYKRRVARLNASWHAAISAVVLKQGERR